jgi:hypothetical protein
LLDPPPNEASGVARNTASLEQWLRIKYSRGWDSIEIAGRRVRLDAFAMTSTSVR